MTGAIFLEKNIRVLNRLARFGLLSFRQRDARLAERHV
jgi:hypothetical protein